MELLSITSFLDSLIGKIYKILPLKESQNTHLPLYLKSLIREIEGSLKSFPILCESREYITIVNTINFMRFNQYDIPVCRYEVFKMLNLIDALKKKVGD